MRKVLPLLVMVFIFVSITKSQTILFTDSFEAGTSSWLLTNYWGTEDSLKHSGTYCLTESPNGNYTNNENSSATLAQGVSLGNALSAELSFWAIYDIETGFDYCYLDASGNGGVSWNNIASFNGDNNLTPWIKYTYSLGGYVGDTNIKIRFRMVSDGAVVGRGMYIDDLTITSFSTDLAPPLILFSPPEHYKGTLGAYADTIELVDISGIAYASIIYSVDGGTPSTFSCNYVSGDKYTFTIPQQTPGAWVDYRIIATDSSVAANTDTSDVCSYISGNYIGYDNLIIDFVSDIGPTAQSGNTGAAVKITLSGSVTLVTSLIRNYTDVNRPNDSMLVHVWSSSFGMPGTDLITPFKVFPEATLSNPSPMTRIDLRPYSSQLSSLTGDIFIGYTVPSGFCWLNLTQPAVAGRTYTYSGSTSAWSLATDDYHFRAITSGVSTGIRQESESDVVSLYPNPMNYKATIEINSPNKYSNLNLVLYDLLGRKVDTYYNVNNNKIEVYKGNLTNGIYIFKIYDKERALAEGKMVIY